MSAFPLVVSFYTKDTYYQWEVQNLIASCQELGVEHHVEGIASLGSWELNCAYKPFFIHRMLQEFKRPVFWLDADAVFVREPSFLPIFASADISTRIHFSLPAEHPSRVISGSVFVNYTAGGDQVVRLWAGECQRQLSDPGRTEEFWDQIALRDILFGRGSGVRVESLPATYTKIAGHVFDEEEVKEPVIEHYQASRRFKKMIT